MIFLIGILNLFLAIINFSFIRDFFRPSSDFLPMHIWQGWFISGAICLLVFAGALLCFRKRIGIWVSMTAVVMYLFAAYAYLLNLFLSQTQKIPSLLFSTFSGGLTPMIHYPMDAISFFSIYFLIHLILVNRVQFR